MHLDFRRSFHHGAAAALAAACLALPTSASSDTYPSRPIRIVVTTAPGGPMDAVSRGVATVLAQALGQAVVIDNRPGADGIIATDTCAKAPPDGYTLCVLDNFTLVLNPLTHAKLPYDPVRDLVPVIHYGFLATTILTRPDFPASSMKELQDYVRANPGKVTWGSWGNSSMPSLYMEYLKATKGLVFLNVPYKGGALTYPAVLGGEIDLGVLTAAPAAKSIESGRTKALFITGPSHRSPFLPNVQTAIESGLDLNLGTWLGLMAPAKVPPEIVKRINALIAKEVFGNPAQREKIITALGLSVEGAAGGSPEAFAALIAAEREKLTKVAKVIGLKAE